MTFSKTASTLGTAAILTIAAFTPSFAAPVLSSTATVAQATSPQTIDVRWRGGGIAAGVATGLIVGGALAASQQPYYNSGYYAPAYAPAYAPGYAYAPAYDDSYAYAPAYGYETAPVYRGSYRSGAYRCGDAGQGRVDYSLCR